MQEHIHVQNEITLLPDSELLRAFQDAQRNAGSTTTRAADRSSLRQMDRRLEAIRNEIEKRGLIGPPWWSKSA